MFLYLKKFISLIFSKTILIILIWLIIISSVAVFLASKEYFFNLRSQKNKLENKKTSILKTIDDINLEIKENIDEVKILQKKIETNLKKIQTTRAKIKKIEKKIKSITGIFNRLYNYTDRLINGEKTTRESKDNQKELQKLSKDKNKLLKEEENIKSEKKSLTLKINKLNEYLKDKNKTLNKIQKKSKNEIIILDNEIKKIDQDIAIREKNFYKIKYWLKKSFEYTVKSLIIITLSILLLPIISKLFFYYIIAPLTSLSSPIKIYKNNEDLEKENFTKIETTQSHVSHEIEVKKNQNAIIQHKFLQASQEGLKKNTKLLFSWKFPLLSLACRLVEMTEIKNISDRATITNHNEISQNESLPNENNNSSNPSDDQQNINYNKKTITISSQENPNIEINVISLPKKSSIICRPHFLAGIITKNKHHSNLIKSHWKIFHLQSWLTLQFRFFEFIGPAKIILWANRGVRKEIVNHNSKRTNQHSTIGFTPNLAYKTKRAETFWSYFRNKNPLYDDIFIGEGIFLCQQIPKSEQELSIKNFWNSIGNAILKIIGF